MYNPFTFLVVAYFLTYLPIFETYFLQQLLPRWNQILTQLRFIHSWVVMGVQWMVHWWVLVHCGRFPKVDACVPIMNSRKRLAWKQSKCHNTMYRMLLSIYPIWTANDIQNLSISSLNQAYHPTLRLIPSELIWPSMSITTKSPHSLDCPSC